MDNFIDLLDGTRLELKFNFGTLYYLAQCGGNALAEKIQKKEEKKQKTTDMENMNMASKIIYSILRSSGLKVTEEEARELMPADTYEVQKILDTFDAEIEKQKKKRESEGEYEEDDEPLEIDWALYMVCAREMGMSEEEFFHSSPFFFNECYRIFRERKEQEVSNLWQMT